MLMLADPSSLTAVVPKDGLPVAVPISAIQATAVADGHEAGFTIRWEGWNKASYTERPKRGLDVLRQEFRRHE